MKFSVSSLLLVLLTTLSIAQTAELDKARAKRNKIKNETVMGYAYENEHSTSKIGVKKSYRSFDSQGNVIKEYIYDKNSKIAEKYLFKYNKKGLKTAAMIYRGNDTLVDKYAYSYNKNDKVVKRAGSAPDNKYEINYTYDNSGNVLSRIKTSEDGSMLFSYHYSYGENGEVATESYKGNITVQHDYSYNSLNQLVEKRATVDGNPGFYFKYEYDSAGNKSLEFKHHPNGSVIESWYYTYVEGQAKTIEKYNYLGFLVYKWQYFYDDKDNVSQIKILEGHNKVPTYLTEFIYTFSDGSKSSPRK